MNRKRIKKAVFLAAIFLLAENAVAQSLRTIDENFVAKHLQLRDIKFSEDRGESQPLPGCQEFKSFTIIRGITNAGALTIQICREGDLGPTQYAATIEKATAPFVGSAVDDSHLKPDERKARAKILSRMRGFPVTLGQGRVGRSLLLPLIGHGIVFVSIAIAPTKDNNATIVVQSDADLDSDLDLTEKLGPLLIAIDRATVD